MRIKPVTAGIACVFGGCVGIAALAQAQQFGTPEDVDYAEQLWQALVDARLAGTDAFDTVPYEGTDPHGAILETLLGTLTVEGRDAAVVVKRNYGPTGVSVQAVQGDRQQHLAAVTVMFKRADGYDPDNGNWYWAKYLPDGSLDRSEGDVAMAGKVQGCITCHQAAPGDDFLYTTDAQL